MRSKVHLLLLVTIFLYGCGSEDSGLEFEELGNKIPSFNSDSAYSFVKQQVDFGPRYPNSEGHKATADYLENKLAEYAGKRNVFRQEFTHESYEGESLQLVNIIAAFNPESRKRIMLSAHWDTRPRADQDPDTPDEPILGADDGGSGVGVLLELARLMSEQEPDFGVDIILFDGEDYGKEGDAENYFLGSRYWSENPPVEGYNPQFGILLDMVGGEGAQFPKEQNSMDFAPTLMNEVWRIAADMNLDDRFIEESGSAVSDDHVVVYRLTGIPIINIIRHEPDRDEAKFAPYWHTLDDDMDIISRKTLEETGIVLTELIYNRFE